MSPHRIISFSLWGVDPKYLIGAIENVKLQEKYYPGWKCRFYIDDTVPSDIIKELNSSGAEIIKENRSDGYRGLFWRFQPAFDSNIELFIVRDCDSRLNEREADAVSEWLTSGKDFHAMRDHKEHNIAILGAMWGAKRGFLPDFQRRLNDFLSNTSPENIIKRGRFFYTDQTFLNCFIWPEVKDNCIIHDDWARVTGTERPFRIKLPEGLFVGQQWGPDNQPLKIPI